MTDTRSITKVHPQEAELSGLLDKSLTDSQRERIEEHIAGCEECLRKVVSAYEAVKEFQKKAPRLSRKDVIMKKINIYLILSITAFLLSFAVPRYFVQFLVATLLLGIKWIVDAKSTRMLVMIYEAWKKGGEKEASRILQTFDSNSKSRL